LQEYPVVNDDTKMASNMSIRASLDTIIEIMGDNGAKIIFRCAGIDHIYTTPPPYDLNPCIPVRQQTQIFIEVEELVGLRGALSIWRRIGYAATKTANEVGRLFDSYKDLPLDEKYNKCIELVGMAIGKGKTIMSGTGKVDFYGFDCTLCSPYYSDGIERSVCFVYTGVFQYVADWVYGKNVTQVVETKCKAKGDDTCYYQLQMVEE
jgi:predicted hydrocarbon binding protein